jgi:hypothetical protein
LRWLPHLNGPAPSSTVIILRRRHMSAHPSVFLDMTGDVPPAAVSGHDLIRVEGRAGGVEVLVGVLPLQVADVDYRIGTRPAPALYQWPVPLTTPTRRVPQAVQADGEPTAPSGRGDGTMREPGRCRRSRTQRFRHIPWAWCMTGAPGCGD